MNKRQLVRRLLKGAALLVLSGGVAVAAALVWVAVEHRTEATLPAPTGPFAVGRAVYDWADAGVTDPVASPGRRELLVWIWYPADGRSGTADDYFPAALRAALDGTGPPILRLLSRDPSKVHAHSLRAADVSPRQQSYPVVVLRAGASAQVARYSTLAEDLASHGYVAIGGANHFLFSDDGALRSRVLLRALRLVGIVGIDGRRQLAVTAHCVHTFFDAYLKGARASPFKTPSPQYPEIQPLE